MILDFGTLRRFTPISLADACAAGLPTSAGVPMVSAAAYLPADEAVVPAISYGATSLEGRTLRQTPHDTAEASRYSTAPMLRYLIREAVVHSRHGFVTSGHHIFTDFLDHIPLHLMPGVGPQDDGGWMFPATAPQTRLTDAVHMLAANLENYFHWLMDVLARFDPTLCARLLPFAPPVLLVPQPVHGWQEQSLALLPTAAMPVMRVDDMGVVAVERLHCVPSLAGGGFFPHPAALRPFRAWRARLDPDSAPFPGRRGRRIYISRMDSDQRRLVNEPAVIDTVRRAGFEVVTLTGMDVAAQVRLFSAASRVIAPHGAGLTNLLFCRAGTKVLELHMDGYVQWAFRRLAGLAGLHYGCVIGTANEPWQDWAHLNSWTLDIAELEAVLQGF